MMIPVHAWCLLAGVGSAAALIARPGEPSADRDQPLFVWSAGDGASSGGPELAAAGVIGADGESASERRAAYENQLGSKGKGEHRQTPPKPRVVGPEMRTVLLPKAKLAVCKLPKVASTQISGIFAELNGFHAPWKRSVQDLSTPRNLGVDFCNEVRKENGWTLAFFTRDPMARYLSAWGSKCVINAQGFLEDDGHMCGGETINHPLSLEAMVAAFERRALNDYHHGLPKNNRHWTPMSILVQECEQGCRFINATKSADLERRWFPIHSSGSLDGNMTKLMESLFEDAGMMQAHPNMSAKLIEYFPVNRVAGHSSKSHNKEGIFFRNSSVAAAVAKMYEDDYRWFQLPAPQYAPHE